jgi:hypothetical protein
MKMKKGSLWVCFVVLVFGLLMFVTITTGCQKKEAPSEQPAVTESATPPAPPATATTGGAAAPSAPAAPAPTGSAQ